MEKTIYKYTLALGNHKIQMPKGAEVIHVEAQFDSPCFWMLVDPNAEMEEREFDWYATGDKISNPNKKEYKGTVLLSGGAMVFHLFEIIK